MIALCPSCHARIRIDVEQIVERNLVRCSKCWFVFVVDSEEISAVRNAARQVDDLSGSELSQRFAEWEKRSLADDQMPNLDDVSLSGFDWTGFDAGEEGDTSLGEGTILSAFEGPETTPGESEEILCTLSIVEGPKTGLSIPVTWDNVLIGRESARIRLEDPEISRRHAEIALIGRNGTARFAIEDLGSTNGTFVNDQKITEKVQLTNCDEIRIGQTCMVFFIGKPVVLSPRPALDASALGQLGSSPEVARVAPAAASDAGADVGEMTRTVGLGNPLLPQRLPKMFSATIEVLEGPDAGKLTEVSKGAFIIGRDQADVQLSDPQVSRKHALVEILARDQVFVKDLASKNGTIVNGILVKVARLFPGDTIQVGTTRLTFNAEGFE